MTKSEIMGFKWTWDYFLLFCTCLCILDVQVNGFISDDYNILTTCRLYCDIDGTISEKDSYYCSRECQMHQCHTGCSLYKQAISDNTCFSTCNNQVTQSSSKSETELNNVVHLLVQSCIQGCSRGLDEYYKDLVGFIGGKLPQANVINKGITHDSVELSWPPEDWQNNVTFTLQTCLADSESDWQNHDDYMVLPSGNVNITNLLPFVTYEFKRTFHITSAHSVETEESKPVTTLPFGVPSSTPRITSLIAPSPTTISVSWRSPIHTNGPLLSYSLSLHPLAEDGHVINVDVPPQRTSWIFGQLLAGQQYEVRVLGVNEEGEGPESSMKVTTPMPGNLSLKEAPYLILGAENYVVKQPLLELTRDYDKIAKRPRSILVTGVGVHVAREQVLVSDDSGRVTLVDINGTLLAEDIYPYLSQPAAIDVDWLHNYAYIADSHRLYRCSVLEPFYCHNAMELFPFSPREVKVDPITGYLFYTIHENKGGLYRVDLADINTSTEPSPTLLIEGAISTFAIDHESLLVYYPNSSHNTVMSAFLDGTGVTDTRTGSVARPHFLNIDSLVKYDGKYFWTNGTRVFSEEFDPINRTYYHHSLALFERHFSGFNLWYPTSQPVPVPLSPPRQLEVLFTSTSARVTWHKPARTSYQGEGAFSSWSYEVEVVLVSGLNTQLHVTSGLHQHVTGLLSDAQYRVRVRAKSRGGRGPWSDSFMGSTLQPDGDTARLIVAVQHVQHKTWELREVGLDGTMYETRVTTPPIHPGVTDLTWHEDKLFWTDNDGRMFLHKGGNLVPNLLSFVEDARCLAFDWLALKLYWSVYRNAQIKRADMYGNNEEFIYLAQARHMALDSAEGRLYWVTMTTVESTTLNGNDHVEYFGLEPFSINQIISLTIDHDHKRLVWYVKGFEEQSLYVADLLTMGQSDTADVISSVTLLGKIQDINRYSVLQFFSGRLVWLGEDQAVRVGDAPGNHTATITLDRPATMVTVVHPTLHPYPAGLNCSTVCVLPQTISPSSVGCQGEWSEFNITWQQSTEVNHGNIWYEVAVETEGQSKIVEVVERAWYAVFGLAPYSQVTVALQAFTVWGAGQRITTNIRSPMAAPSQPVGPKVYVTQRKNAASSKQTLAADFRWSEPAELNGILSQQHVYYWQSNSPDDRTKANLSPSARHFILDNLQGNITYYFQVECCTAVGCGPRSAIVNATTDAVNPVPRLIIATKGGIMVGEADNIRNTSVTMATKSVVALAHLSQEDRYFWITREGYVEQFPSQQRKKLLQLDSEGHHMTLDWVSRSLYVTRSNQSHGAIFRYEMDKGIHSVVIERPAPIGKIAVDPFTSSLLWTEQGDTHSWRIYKSNTNNLTLTEEFFSQPPPARQSRDLTPPCSCPRDVRVGPGVTVDLVKNGGTELVFVELGSMSLIAADMQGCQCRVLLNTTEKDRKGLPASHMTVDHVNLYWYHSDSSTLYMLDKETGMVRSTSLPHVTDILAFGSHLQPLPGSECLDVSPYADPVHIVSYTNTSVRVWMTPVSWPEQCLEISHPAVRYTVFYKVLDDMNPYSDCSDPNYMCSQQFSYTGELEIEGLTPYTYYILQGAVSSQYSQYSVLTLGQGSTLRTRPGVPSRVENVTLEPQNPNLVIVRWPLPAKPNGPVDKIEYFVRWSAVLQDGEKRSTMSEAITYSDYQEDMYGRFSKRIENLLPDQTYSIQVFSNQTSGGYLTESSAMQVHTFQQPSDLELYDVTNTSIHLTWRSPSDDATQRVTISYQLVQENMSDIFMSSLDNLPILTENNTLYNESFEDLKPNTEYAFQLHLIYNSTMYNLYHWPTQESGIQYVFKTLTGIPDSPDPPIVEEIKEGQYEVRWAEPEDNGEAIQHYILQYKLIDKDNWSVAYNTTDLRWVIDESVLQRGYTYLFRVQAKNSNGWGPVSLNSTLFSFPILEVEPEDDMVTVVAIVSALIFVIIAMAAIAIYSICRRRREEKKKRKEREFVTVARGPDLELATLRELPLTAIQQNNTLYAMNMIPTDDEIAALPHFRRDQLVLCKFLGSGAFGEVFEGVAKNIINESSGDTRCAVKTLRKSASDQEKDEFLKEALLMSNFHHEHILSLLGVCLDNDPQFIILELMEGGDLLSFLRACRLSSIQHQSRVELSLMDLVKICVHVASGCKYLEDMHFVHRDLAARNCLVSSCNPATMVVKIGDFGLARDIYKNDYYRKEGEGLLPVRWMSPESLVDGVFTTQSDIWAFGVLMWEVVTFGQQPYPARTNIEVLHFVRSSGRLDRPDNCPEDFYQLMCKCWSFAPEDRPSFAYLLQQLQKFHETCTSVSEYLIPISSTNRALAAAGGFNYLSMRQRRLTSTSSDDPDYRHIDHSSYGSHKSYGKIRRATSFDSPEPKDATQQLKTDGANYLQPKSRHVPQYIEFLPEDRTVNYMYDLSGNRCRDLETKPDNLELKSSTKSPNYVQTTVKENFPLSGSEYAKYVNHKKNSSSTDQDDSEVKSIFAHQKNSADSVIMKSVERIPSVLSVKNGNLERQNSMNSCSDTFSSQIITVPSSNYASNTYRPQPRKQRLDSSNSIKSFDSVQTEPAYMTYNRSKLYSTSSSKSNYSMSNISESAVEQLTPPTSAEVTPDPRAQQFWANSSSDCANLASRQDLKAHLDYLNMSARSQVYPETAGPLAGYDIVHASLV
ncbi:proto-oncogene tyrosine-protein kinase ROS-like isoform X2 [Mya arenaria]|uniref:proto-oncogene tyrosine-protein kinase ROS-like isoform X2 n=1 Tax=Mya arenaria TaxID=6604 RepID=UPI0022E3B2FE|nr:proto-oncogene tyrosine-protein kinase ROS-like isoform X2 [Mya arenaria]